MTTNTICCLILGISCFWPLVACSKSADAPKFELELSAESVALAPGEAKVMVDIRFSDYDRLNYLQVRKIAGTSTIFETMPQRALAPVYRFEYAVTLDDPASFSFEFSAVGKGGRVSKLKTLQVTRSVSGVSLTLDRTSDRPDDMGIAAVTLTFGNFENLDALLVERYDWEQGTRQRIEAAQLLPEYRFEYTIREEDSDYVSFWFTAVDKAGCEFPTQFFAVDRRTGLGLGDVTCLSRVTGDEQNGGELPRVEIEVNNRTDLKYNVGGTDLGIVWEMTPGRYGLFFGDTYGSDFRPNPAAPGPNGGSWRCNVLLFSQDQDLSDGLTIDGAVMDAAGKSAREIGYGAKDVSGHGDWTSIPTAAVRANGADYMYFMNIRTWTDWVTNYSGLYKSVDDGANWEPCRSVEFGSDSPFGQVGYFRKEGYVYMVGTQTGRNSKPALARFRETDIERPSEYEYWSGSRNRWVQGDETAATPIFNDLAGELSIAYHQKFGKWIILYFNGPRYEISFRTADDIIGPWSLPERVAGGDHYPQLYGSFIHPLSLKGDKLYFLMSMWLPYNAYLMEAELVRK